MARKAASVAPGGWPSACSTGARISLAYRGESRRPDLVDHHIAAATVLPQPATQALDAADPGRPSLGNVGAAIMVPVAAIANPAAMPDVPGRIGARTPGSIPLPFPSSDAAAGSIGYVPWYDRATNDGSARDWLCGRVLRDPGRDVLTNIVRNPDDPFDHATEDRCLAA